MISRFALATFFYSTNGETWNLCIEESVGCSQGREWLTAENECEWSHVSCQGPDDGDHVVTAIQFAKSLIDRHNVTGTLPFEMVFLSNLQEIFITDEYISGSIPEGWSAMTALRELLLGYNRLTGSFPDFLFGEKSVLENLVLSRNALKGPMAPFISSTLKRLELEVNSLTGPIPSTFGTLQNLTYFTAYENRFKGEVPEGMFSLPNLEKLDVSNNRGLNGTIPEIITAMQSLEHLYLHNTSMSGTLPLGLFDLINLQMLSLNSSSFSGTLPDDFAKLSNAEQIQPVDNNFTGTIPEGFGLLSYLRKLELYGNLLTGTVPEAICNRTGEAFYDINFLTADCTNEVSCDC